MVVTSQSDAGWPTLPLGGGGGGKGGGAEPIAALNWTKPRTSCPKDPKLFRKEDMPFKKQP